MSDNLQQAIAAIKAGDKETGQQLLMKVIKADPKNEAAWLWMASTLDDPQEKKECLQKVLQINPKNATANKALTQLEPPQPIELPRFADISPKPAQEAAPSTDPAGSRLWRLSLLVLGGVAVLLVLCIGAMLVLPSIVGREGLVSMFSPSNPPAPATEPEQTFESYPPTWTPARAGVSRSCLESVTIYMEHGLPLALEFAEAAQLAESRAGAAVAAQDMERIARDLQSLPMPECAQEPAELMTNGYSTLARGYTAFAAGEPDSVVDPILAQGLLDSRNGLQQIVALTYGQPTPTLLRNMDDLVSLPTTVPIRTRVPNSTPMPSGRSFRVGDWELRVEKVEIVESLSTSISTRRARGRFAVVFLAATNRGLATDVHISAGDIAVEDRYGSRSELDLSATPMALIKYDMLGGLIHPDETGKALAVFDIHEDAGPYTLVPGMLASSGGPADWEVLLDIP